MLQKQEGQRSWGWEWCGDGRFICLWVPKFIVYILNKGISKTEKKKMFLLVVCVIEAFRKEDAMTQGK